jgi:hypothetical protein
MQDQEINQALRSGLAAIAIASIMGVVAAIAIWMK